MHSIEASPASKWGINFILRTKCMRKSPPTPCSAECKCRTPLASLKAGRCRTVELFACHRAYRIFPVRHGAAAKTSDLWARGVSDANVSCNPGLSKPSNDGDHSIVPPRPGGTVICGGDSLLCLCRRCNCGPRPHRRPRLGSPNRSSWILLIKRHLPSYSVGYAASCGFLAQSTIQVNRLMAKAIGSN